VEIGPNLSGNSEPRTVVGVNGNILHPFQPGQSGNPNGRPKAARLVSAALAELQDASGATPDECIEAFKAARGAKLCGADHKAIALFRAENDACGKTQVSAIETALDRLEGKVPSMTSLVGADGGPLRIEWVNDWRNAGGSEG